LTDYLFAILVPKIVKFRLSERYNYFSTSGKSIWYDYEHYSIVAVQPRNSLILGFKYSILS